jgi:glyoxalase family protein
VVASGGTNALKVTDPAGLNIQLIETAEDERSPWIPEGIPSGAAVRGLHSVTLCLQTPGPTVTLMSEVLGFEVVDERDRVTRLAVQGDAPGRRIELTYGAGAPPARNGLGTVHHVAMAIASPDEQLLLRRELVAMGYAVTEVLDRQYFKSIYFREPGGVLFEVATMEPGFTVDEPLPALGRGLKLPPWEEPNRRSIESGLPPVT